MDQIETARQPLSYFLADMESQNPLPIQKNTPSKGRTDELKEVPRESGEEGEGKVDGVGTDDNQASKIRGFFNLSHPNERIPEVRLKCPLTRRIY